jgi:UDP-GlcNAc:undecaprenyl-phosphate GlcNAc-1-phosphate transferase
VTPAALALPAGVAFAVGALALLVLARFARHLKLLDAPGTHKTHDADVPSVGGIAIVAGALAGLALLPHDRGPGMLATVMFGLLGVGVVDDLHGLSPRLRFVAQILAALVLATWAGALLRDFGELLWPGRVAALGYAAWPVTVFCFVGVLNATNMIDGIDGLAGGFVLLALAGMGWFAWRAGAHVEVAVLACVAAAALAFLASNAPVLRRARVFLGNGGSLVLGCVVAWAVIRLSQEPTRAFAPVTGLWLFAVPLIDTVSVMWRRLAERLSPFQADHSHVHHLLMRSGYSARATWLLLLAAGVVCVALGVAGELLPVPEAVRFAAFLAVAFGYHAWARRRSARLPSLAEVRRA